MSRLSIVVLLISVVGTLAFVPSTNRPVVVTSLHVASAGGSNFLLDEFKTASGEVLDPYRVLKVSRTADRKEIRNAYRTFSKKYHPDGARFRDILPGSCNNEHDIREEWERIKLSYEILSDKKTRMRYDRHSTIANPGAAMQRAVLEGVGWGFTKVGKGLLGAVQAGANALQEQAIAKDNDENEKQSSPNRADDE